MLRWAKKPRDHPYALRLHFALLHCTQGTQGMARVNKSPSPNPDMLRSQDQSFKQRTVKPSARLTPDMLALLLPKTKEREFVPLTVLLQ